MLPRLDNFFISWPSIPNYRLIEIYFQSGTDPICECVCVCVCVSVWQKKGQKNPKHISQFKMIYEI